MNKLTKQQKTLIEALRKLRDDYRRDCPDSTLDPHFDGFEIARALGDDYSHRGTRRVLENLRSKGLIVSKLDYTVYPCRLAPARVDLAEINEIHAEADARLDKIEAAMDDLDEKLGEIDDDLVDPAPLVVEVDRLLAKAVPASSITTLSPYGIVFHISETDLSDLKAALAQAKRVTS